MSQLLDGMTFSQIRNLGQLDHSAQSTEARDTHPTPRMVMEFRCPICQQRLRASDSAAGKSGRCPSCQTRFRLPRQGLRRYMHW